MASILRENSRVFVVPEERYQIAYVCGEDKWEAGAQLEALGCDFDGSSRLKGYRRWHSSISKVKRWYRCRAFPGSASCSPINSDLCIKIMQPWLLLPQRVPPFSTKYAHESIRFALVIAGLDCGEAETLPLP